MIGSIVSIALFMFAHLLTAVWWASKMTANATSMNKAIDRLSKVLEKHDDRFYEKREASDQIARRDREITDIWGAIDSLRQRKRNE